MSLVVVFVGRALVGMRVVVAEWVVCGIGAALYCQHWTPHVHNEQRHTFYPHLHLGPRGVFFYDVGDCRHQCLSIGAQHIL